MDSLLYQYKPKNTMIDFFKGLSIRSKQREEISRERLYRRENRQKKAVLTEGSSAKFRNLHARDSLLFS